MKLIDKTLKPKPVVAYLKANVKQSEKLEKKSLFDAIIKLLRKIWAFSIELR
jgi:hypothetical protein